jgi:membrane associated rhomboid family serine protease
MMESGNDQQFRDRLIRVGSNYKTQLMILGGFILLIWLLEIIDWLFLDGSLDRLGIKPRTLSGLRGILFMPFLHKGFGHLLANTVPFLVLGALVMMHGINRFFIVSGLVMVIGGVGVWIFGSSGSVHIGASGIIFGYFGFLLTSAYFERSMRSIIIAFAVLVFYGGILWGLLPFWLGVSWLGHLFGFVGGVLAAYLLNRRRTI